VTVVRQCSDTWLRYKPWESDCFVGLSQSRFREGRLQSYQFVCRSPYGSGRFYRAVVLRCSNENDYVVLIQWHKASRKEHASYEERHFAWKGILLKMRDTHTHKCNNSHTLRSPLLARQYCNNYHTCMLPLYLLQLDYCECAVSDVWVLLIIDYDLMLLVVLRSIYYGRTSYDRLERYIFQQAQRTILWENFTAPVT
jgi:hypothetical protein